MTRFLLSCALILASCSSPRSRQTSLTAAPLERDARAGQAFTAAPISEPPAAPGPHVLAPGVAEGKQGAVASAESHASRAGIDVLRKGGNAIDAAIAVAFALAVTHPSAGNLGGGGFMIVRTAQVATALDFREVAPAAAKPNMYLDAKGEVTQDSVLGARAAGVAGTVAGLALAHQRFGTLEWSALVAPAVQLAREGHVLDASHAQDIADAANDMRDAGFAESAAIYLGADGQPLPAGATWEQPVLAETLTAIAEGGGRAFYRGPLAQRIAAGVKKLGGLWTVRDLAAYRAIERAPLELDYRGHHVITMPPPSAGGIVLSQILGASELLGIYAKPYRSADAIHLYVEAARRAYADRNHWVGDPEFEPVPIARLTAREYIEARMSDIDPKAATPSSRVAPGSLVAAPSGQKVLRKESEETTHFSVVDRLGNAVAVTYTLNGSFGAKVVVPGTGILLNNEMDDFASKPGVPNAYGLVQGKRNAIAKGKRMLSSMTPTIVTKDGKLRAVLGTPGGPTITNTVAEILMALIDHAQPLEAAVRAPRFHHQWLPDQISVEASLEPALTEQLQARGHVIKTREAIGHADCIEVDLATGMLRAVTDVTRDSGGAEAY